LGPCPSCGAPLLETERAYGCSQWRAEAGGCRFTLWKTVLGKRLTEAQARELLSRGSTSRAVRGFRKGTGGTFAARLELERETGRIRFHPADGSPSGR
jgi:DNA topoisomerase-3